MIEPIEGHPIISPQNIIQRPKVVYSDVSQEWHMHWHADNSSYGLLLQGYATSPTVQVRCRLPAGRGRLLIWTDRALTPLSTPRHLWETGRRTLACSQTTRTGDRTRSTQTETASTGGMCTSRATTMTRQSSTRSSTGFRSTTSRPPQSCRRKTPIMPS